jgi:hypothetical protein
MHRIARAMLEGKEEAGAVRLLALPELGVAIDGRADRSKLIAPGCGAGLAGAVCLFPWRKSSCHLLWSIGAAAKLPRQGFEMSSNTLAIVIACIAGAISLVTAFGVERLRQHGERAKLAQDKALEEFRSESAMALEQFRDRRNRELAEEARTEEANRVIARYRDPLLRSAYDLQSRIYNIYRPGGFRGGRDPEYFRLNTLFLFAEFLGWLEIIRREIQFLDVGAVRETKVLTRALQGVQDQIAETYKHHDDELYLYRGQQRAIGELMLVRAEGPTTTGLRYECMGYAAFAAAQENPAFASWFTRLGDAISQLPQCLPERLILVQHALIDLIDLLDPGRDRFESGRDLLPESESSG